MGGTHFLVDVSIIRGKIFSFPILFLINGSALIGGYIQNIGCGGVIIIQYKDGSCYYSGVLPNELSDPAQRIYHDQYIL